MEVRLENMGFSYGDHRILDGIDLVLDKNELTCILGPNGVGKTTMMYCVNKLLTPTEGHVYIDGRDVTQISRKEMSKMISFVPHNENATFSMSVMDTVLMGRTPYSGTIYSDTDVRIAAENIKLMGLTDLSMHPFDELSAGQHQKVIIARGLTQEPRLILLDEPTANLDVRYQLQVMRLLRDLARVKSINVVAICHDLNVTAMYADRIVMVYGGKIYADGNAKDVLTPENIKAVYGVECEVTEVNGRPHIVLLDSDELDSHLENLMVDDGHRLG